VQQGAEVAPPSMPVCLSRALSLSRARALTSLSHTHPPSLPPSLSLALAWLGRSSPMCAARRLTRAARRRV
jgi:hypothetical protein